MKNCSFCTQGERFWSSEINAKAYGIKNFARFFSVRSPTFLMNRPIEKDFIGGRNDKSRPALSYFSVLPNLESPLVSTLPCNLRFKKLHLARIVSSEQHWPKQEVHMANPTNAVNWFEIPVNNMEKAKKFYESVFGVQLSPLNLGQLNMSLFPMAQGAAGAAGSLVKANSYVPSHAGSMVYFSVDDIEATLARVAKNGGKILNPKVNIGEYGFVGHFEDCEGNRVALHSMK